MRNAIVACIFICCINLNFAQSTKFNSNGIVISQEKPQKQKLSVVLKKIADKENFYLAHESDLLENIYCRVNLVGLNLTQSLDLILKNSGLEYEVVNNHQILIRKSKIKELNYLNLFGKIRDKSSKKDLAFAGIYLQDSSIGSYADSTGNFHLAIQSDYKDRQDTVIIHRIGYEDKKIALNHFIKNMDVELEVKSRLLPLVTILPKINPISLGYNIFGQGSTKINNKENNILTIGSFDILRRIQLLPSVAANKDNSAKLQIRGSETFETLVLIDGLRIYNPTHFYNVFSAVNNDYISEINFHKNGIPPYIRSMTGGVVEMYSNPINFDKISADINANLMDISTVVNLPFSNTIGLSVAGRKSIFEHTKQSIFGEIISANQTGFTDDRIENINDEMENQNFNYYDINAKLTWVLKPNHRLSLNLYKSSDSYKNIFKEENKYGVKKYIKFDFKDISSWGNQGIGIMYNLNWNKSLQSKFAFSSVKYDENAELDIRIFRKHIDTNFVFHTNDTQQSTIADQVFKIDNNWKIDNNKKLIFGMDITKYNVVSEIKIEDNSIFNNNISASSYTIYGGYNHRFNKLAVDLSLQNSYYSGTKNYYFDPSLSINYFINDRWKLFSSINRQHQYLREFNYETKQAKNTSIWSLSDKDTPVLTSINFSIGCQYSSLNSSIVFELYQKNKSGLSTLLLFRPNLNEIEPDKNLNYKVFFGDSYVRGLDILWIQRINKYRSQLSYTLSVDNQRFKMIFHNQFHPSPDDSRHQIKWVQSYRANKFEFGLNFIYSSGTPYFDFSKLERSQNRDKISFENYIQYLPDYFRSDFSVIYNFKMLNYQSKFVISVFNLTNRINITNRQIINANRENTVNESTKLFGSQTNLLSRTINFGIKIRL